MSELKQIPGMRSLTQLVSLLVTDGCGSNLIIDALAEVGIIQYLENAKTGR